MTDKPSYTDASRPYLAPRLVRVASDTPNTATENQPQLLESFREVHAWVLLGEPGAGKSTAFKTEAEAIGGVYLPIADFVVADDLDDDWREKTLFLDGLDEVRAGGDTLRKVRNKLKKLGKPAFRLSCRAADWYGATDQEIIKAAATDGKIAVLLLEPLDEADILRILRDNHGIPNPENFVRDAQKRGIDGLLNNPQTLELLAKAVRGDQFPATRQATYQLACETMAAEANKAHRDKKRGNAISVEAGLEAAGQLCAVLLFANQTGIALDIERVKEGFIEIETCKLPDPDAAHAAIQSKLFRPAATEERVEPAHRTITEFLAARWLGQQIANGLPLKRVLNLLLGCDERTVTGLRGLYAWLALICITARTQLIRADPFTVLIYGDVSPMSIADKRLIFEGLKQEAEQFPAFRSQVPSFYRERGQSDFLYSLYWRRQSAYPFGALSAKELIPDFIEALTDRSEAAQSFADCALEILAEGEALTELAPTVKAVILDATRWDTVRNRALSVWLKYQVDFDELLSDIVKNESEQNDKLAGTLLHHLYPSQIDSAVLLRHLDMRTGIFDSFWVHGEPENVPNADLSILLDSLAQKSPPESYSFSSHLSGNLLVRWLETDGNRVSDEKLFVWLNHPVVGSIPNQPHYIVFSGRVLPRVISNHEKVVLWLKNRPDRYKVLLRK